MSNEGRQHIQFVVENEHTNLPGVWDMNISEENIFRPDQPFSIHGFSIESPAHFIINQARILIHPDDIHTLRKECEKLGTEMPVYNYFRIITPAGEVKIVYLEAMTRSNRGKRACHGKLEEEGGIAAHPYAGEADGFVHLLLATTEQFVSAGTWQVNLHTHKTLYSANLYRIYGVIPGSLKAHTDTFRRFVHPDEKRIVTETFDRAIQERIPFHLEYRIITEQGESRHVKQISKIVRNELTESLLIGITEDITERKNTELALREAQEQAAFQQEIYSITEKITETGYWQLNVRTRKIVFSDNFFRLHGLKPQAQGYELFLHYVHPEDRDKVSQAFRNAIDKHVPPRLSYQISRPDGKIRRLQLYGKTVTNADREIVLICIVRDITEDYLLDSHLEKAKSEAGYAGESNLYMEEIAGVGSWRTDLQTQEIKFSSNFMRLFGLRPMSADSAPKELARFIHPDDQEALIPLFTKMFYELQTVPSTFRIITLDGKLRWVQLENRLLKTEAKDRFLMGIIQDTTREKGPELQVHRLNRFIGLVGDTMRGTYFITDIHHNIESYNKRFSEQYDIKELDVRNRNVSDVVPPMKHPSVIDNLERALRGEKVFLPNYRSCLNNQYLDVYMAPLVDPDENVTAVLTIIQDITPEITLRQELTQRLQLIENLIENTIDRIIVLDENLNFLIWNKQCEMHFGLMKDQALAKNVLEAFPLFKKDNVYENLRRALNGESVYLPGGNPVADGGYFEQYLIPLRDEKEKIYAVLWLVHDFTREHVLTEKHQKANTILNAMNEGCFEVDCDNYCFRYLNKKAEEMLGMPAAQLIGKCIWDVFPHSQTTPLYTGVLHTCKTSSPFREEYFSDFLNKWVLLKVTPSANGVIVLLLDLQEKKEAEEIRLLAEHVSNHVQEPIYIVDLVSAELLYTNRVWSEQIGHTLTGTDREQDSFLAYVDANDKKLVEQHLDKMKTAADGEARMIRYRIVNASGQAKWVTDKTLVIRRNVSGTPTQQLGILIDFTETKQADQDRNGGKKKSSGK